MERKGYLWRTSAALLAVILLTGLLAACGGQSAGTGQEKVKLRLGYLNVMDDAQTILAARAGIYEKHGIDAEMVLFSSGTDLIKAIVGGQLDAGVLGFTNALAWLGQGAELKIVGGAQMGYHSMLVNADSGIETVEELKGKSVASQKQGSTADVVLNGVVWSQAGIAREDVTMQYVSPAVAIQSLASGTVDGAFVFEPYASLAKTSYPVKEIYEIGQSWPFPCMVVIASGDIVNNNREAVERMLDAQKEAIEMLENDPAEAAKWIKDDFIAEETVTKLDGTTIPAVDVIKMSIESQDFSWEITEQDIQKMKEIAQMMVDQEILDTLPDVDSALDLTWQQKL